MVKVHGTIEMDVVADLLRVSINLARDGGYVEMEIIRRSTYKLGSKREPLQTANPHPHLLTKPEADGSFRECESQVSNWLDSWNLLLDRRQ